MSILTSLSLWLHDLATVIMIGFYLLLALIFLPAMKKVLSKTDVRALLSALQRVFMPWVGAALLVFIVTGIFLMLVNPNYLGVGNFGNLWSILMVLKHIVVIVMIAVGTLLSRLQLSAEKPGQDGRFSSLVRLQAWLGVFVLLLTAFARMG